MRFRYFFLAIIFCALPHASAAALPTDGFDGCDVAYDDDGAAGTPDYHLPAPRPIVAPTPLSLKEKITLDRQSYADVYGILKEENSCSRFFGGPAQAVEAFNQLALQLKKRPLNDNGVAVNMSGTFVTYRNALTGAGYRLFEQATINSNGPLFYKPMETAMRPPPRVGRFPVRTRQARALIFLHEIGHLVRNASGDWVLPNDGGNFRQNEQNTRKVEEHCAAQLLALD